MMLADSTTPWRVLGDLSWYAWQTMQLHRIRNQVTSDTLVHVQHRIVVLDMMHIYDIREPQAREILVMIITNHVQLAEDALHTHAKGDSIQARARDRGQRMPGMSRNGTRPGILTEEMVATTDWSNHHQQELAEICKEGYAPQERTTQQETIFLEAMQQTRLRIILAWIWGMHRSTHQRPSAISVNTVYWHREIRENIIKEQLRKALRQYMPCCEQAHLSVEYGSWHGEWQQLLNEYPEMASRCEPRMGQDPLTVIETVSALEQRAFDITTAQPMSLRRKDGPAALTDPDATVIDRARTVGQ